MTAQEGTDLTAEAGDLLATAPLPVDPVPVEARAYQGHRAGVVSRTIACAIDFALTVVAVGATYVGITSLVFLSDPTGFSFPSPRPLTLLLVGGAYLFVYLTVLWATSGRTYGAHVMGLRVVNFRGRRLRLVGAALRAAFCVAFPIGLFWCVVSRQNRSVQDVVLRTSVVYDWRPRRSRRDAPGPSAGTAAPGSAGQLA